MAIITIISVGTLKEKYLKDAIDEYKKRLSLYARVEEVNLKEERINNEDEVAGEFVEKTVTRIIYT